VNELMIRGYLALNTLTAGIKERVLDREEGQTAAEYLGIIVLVAAIILAIFELDVPTKIKDALGSKIDEIVNAN
jgi:pilus assembly protein Flp/PilA